MQKLGLLAVTFICITLCGTAFVVRAAPKITSVDDVRLGMELSDALPSLLEKYSLKGSSTKEGMREVYVTGGPDARFTYVIRALNGKVVNVETDDAKSYSRETLTVGTELFDALYASARPSQDNLGETLGVRYLDVHVELHKLDSGIAQRTLIFDLPDQDFRFNFLGDSLLVERYRALDWEAFVKISRGGSQPGKEQ